MFISEMRSSERVWLCQSVMKLFPNLPEQTRPQKVEENKVRINENICNTHPVSQNYPESDEFESHDWG